MMSDIRILAEEFASEFPTAQVRFREAMSSHTTFRIGGAAEAMVSPSDEGQLRTLCALCHSRKIKPLLLGKGSNLLVQDEPLHRLVIHTGLLDSLTLEGDTITAQCGVTLAGLAVFAMEHGLTGLEFAHGIPGSVGGAVSMNAGAYGGEMKDVIVSVTCVSPDGSLHVYENSDCDFSYRHSRFSDGADCIVSASFRLKSGDKAEIRACMDDLMARRKAKQPLNLPSAGSTFKRPPNGYASAMIDEAGLRGKGVGNACVSEKHAGFVVNMGGATFRDVTATMKLVQDTVLRTHGTLLEPEVKIIRDDVP